MQKRQSNAWRERKTDAAEKSSCSAGRLDEIAKDEIDSTTPIHPSVILAVDRRPLRALWFRRW